MKVYKIRVEHSLGFFSFYDILADSKSKAEREAENRFLDDFCGGKSETNFRGHIEHHSLKCFTFK